MYKKILTLAVCVLAQICLSMPAAAAEGGAKDVPEISYAQLSDLVKAERGKVVVVNFFATWCPHCRMEIPGLVRLRDTAGDDVAIIGVSLDEDASALDKFLPKMNFNYPIYRDNGEIASRLAIFSIPRNLVFAPNGDMVYDDSGMLNEAGLNSLVERARRHSGN